MATNPYIGSTEKFAEKFPPGIHAMTAVYQFLTELTTGANGYDRDPAFAPEMHIDDPDKQLATIIRRLNSAGKDANIRVTDEKDGNIRVQDYKSYAINEASPVAQLSKLERLAKASEKKAKEVGGLEGLSEADAEKAKLRKMGLDELVKEANQAIRASREFNFITIAKHIGLTDETARKLLPHMDELIGKKR